MTYVSGFLLAVPTENRAAYVAMAEKGWEMFRKHGCLSLRENWGVDVPDGKVTSFPMAVKKKEDETVVFSWMEWPDKALTFGDCAVNPDPTAEQLAQIAIDSAATHFKLTGETPKVALLSFSTKGSAEHPNIDKVREALSLVKQQKPELDIDGELQFDAAYVEEIGTQKAPGSAVAGHCNVFIFPDLGAGNIGYKIAERLGGANAIGPVLQGMAKPWLDLSRGCKPSDIVDAAVIGAVLA